MPLQLPSLGLSARCCWGYPSSFMLSPWHQILPGNPILALGRIRYHHLCPFWLCATKRTLIRPGFSRPAAPGKYLDGLAERPVFRLVCLVPIAGAPSPDRRLIRQGSFPWSDSPRGNISCRRSRRVGKANVCDFFLGVRLGGLVPTLCPDNASSRPASPSNDRIAG